MLGLQQERYKTSLGDAVNQESKDATSKNCRLGQEKKQVKTVEQCQLGSD